MDLFGRRGRMNLNLPRVDVAAKSDTNFDSHKTKGPCDT
jgi:hypothetical protein